ncbi:MAG: hypothetical protein WC628_00110 [Candidatus Omnitrophota bacterium]
MLESDLQLKKDTAKATSPETPEGKEYWDKLYKKAEELFGYENVTIPTLTRPWIVPDEIIIRETTTSAYIYKATLKVMLEQDYLKDSVTYKFDDPRLKALNEYSSQLIREFIIPKLIKEINTSKRYAPLRQVYYSLILAQWFKARFRSQSIANSPQSIVKANPYLNLVDSQNLTGLTSKEDWSKTAYFQAYQKSFKDGEYSVSESVYTSYWQTIRSYFSGGISGFMSQPQMAQELARPIGDAGNKAVLPAATPVAASPVLSEYLIPGIGNADGQVGIITQASELPVGNQAEGSYNPSDSSQMLNTLLSDDYEEERTSLNRQTTGATHSGRLILLHREAIRLLKRQREERGINIDDHLIVVDVGIGQDGAPTTFDLKKALIEEGFSNFVLYGVDNNKEYIKVAEIKRDDTNLFNTGNLQFRFAESFELDTITELYNSQQKIGRVDMITVSNVLRHYDSDGLAIKRMCKVLNPHGILVQTLGPTIMDSDRGDRDTDEHFEFIVYAKNAKPVLGYQKRKLLLDGTKSVTLVSFIVDTIELFKYTFRSLAKAVFKKDKSNTIHPSSNNDPSDIKTTRTELSVSSASTPAGETRLKDSSQNALGINIKNTGGIDFRSLPIVTQAMSNLSLNATRIPLSRLDTINLSQEWREIERILNSGITPSAERIKEYVQVSCLKGDLDQDKVVSCIADILRQEEERAGEKNYSSTDLVLKDILVVLESGRSNHELKAMFIGG